MAKKKAAARQRKKPDGDESPSEGTNAANAFVESSSSDVTPPSVASTTNATVTTTNANGEASNIRATSHMPTDLPVVGSLDHESLDTTQLVAGSLDGRNPENDENGNTEDGDNAQLLPPLSIAMPPATKRTEPFDSAASASSCCSSGTCSNTHGNGNGNGASSALPRTRSLILTGNGTVLQAMPSTKAEVVEVMAEQSWLMTKLTVQLLWALRASRKWMFMAMRLIGFVVCLFPALIRMVYYWAFDAHVHKNIIYGLNGRNLLDVYTVPSDQIMQPATATQQLRPRMASVHIAGSAAASRDAAHKKRPVVVFLTGGAWIIGYKAWGTLMGKALSSFGLVVVMPDYRNFPQGIMPDMVDDATMAMQWVFDNVHHFGGDPENVTLVGQSAGAHIALCALLEQVEKRKQWLEMFGGGDGQAVPPDGATATMAVSSPSSYSTNSAGSSLSSSGCINTNDAILPHAPTWELRQIRSVIGISGPYNIENSIETFHRHGFDRTVVDRIMDHRISYFSPALRFFSYSENARAHALLHDFPPVYLFHGTADATVTWKSSEQLAEALQSCGLRVETQFFKDKTHTDIIIEDPISGSDDLLLGQIVDVIKAQSPQDPTTGSTAFAFAAKFTPPRQYYPRPLVKMARYVNPF